MGLGEEVVVVEEDGETGLEMGLQLGGLKTGEDIVGVEVEVVLEGIESRDGEPGQGVGRQEICQSVVRNGDAGLLLGF